MRTTFVVALEVDHDDPVTEVIEAIKRDLPGTSLYSLAGLKVVGVIDDIYGGVTIKFHSGEAS